MYMYVYMIVLPPSFIVTYIYLSPPPFPFSLGQTPLHLAAGCGSTDVMKQLVKVKADVNVQDSKSGKTALHHSIEKGDLPMTGYLVMEVLYVHVHVCIHVYYYTQCTCTTHVNTEYRDPVL